MRAEERRIASALLRHGPWTHQQQLPRHYLPELRAQPWHNLVGVDAWAPRWLAAAADLVAEAAPALLAEYDDLRRAGRLHRETECIHRHGTGAWLRFELNGVWEERGVDGCAVVAPVACALYSQLRAAGMPLLRAGFSAVDAGGWLRPHCGPTNTQLKWHLGLRVPSGGCAALRVGNESHTWVEGGVLFFDDSFEHEVWNRCAGERVVFQIVFTHPDVMRHKLGTWS